MASGMIQGKAASYLQSCAALLEKKGMTAVSNRYRREKAESESSGPPVAFSKGLFFFFSHALGSKA